MPNDTKSAILTAAALLLLIFAFAFNVKITNDEKMAQSHDRSFTDIPDGN